MFRGTKVFRLYLTVEHDATVAFLVAEVKRHLPDVSNVVFLKDFPKDNPEVISEREKAFQVNLCNSCLFFVCDLATVFLERILLFTGVSFLITMMKWMF